MVLLDTFFDDALAVAVLVAFERRRDGAAKLLDQAFHIGAQRPPLPRRQAERARPVRLGEVVDVTPVAGDGLFGGVPFERADYHARLTGALRSQREKVVALVAHADGEGERLDGAILADHALEGLELGRGVERESGGVTGREQLFGRKGLDRPGHAFPSIRSMSSSLRPK